LILFWRDVHVIEQEILIENPFIILVKKES